MPSTSKSQQRLMGQAYAVRQFMDSNGKEGLNPKDINAEYREKIEDLAKNMSKTDLEHFAKHLEENSPTATLGSVNGMGAAQFPIGNNPGSGDIPMQLTGRLAPKSKKVFKQFKAFTLSLHESNDLNESVKFKNFKDVIVGSEGEDYAHLPGIVVAKGVGEKDYKSKLKKYDESGSMSEIFDSPEDFDYTENKLKNIELVAVKLDSYGYAVYVYGYGGFLAFK
jgi:hypothetical protein